MASRFRRSRGHGPACPARRGSGIKDLPESERPRERLLAQGPGALSDAELLAILLRTGSGAESALGLARRVLAAGIREGRGPGGLRFLTAASVEELASFRGIGLAKAAQIKAAVEIGRRLAVLSEERTRVRGPADVARLLMEDMRYLEQEHFRVVLLNAKNEVLAAPVVSIGSLSAAIVHPREVFRPAVRRAAASVILAHNHPSGDPTPSPEDLRVTQQLIDAGRILGIDVLDHVILGDNRYVSLRERHGDWPWAAGEGALIAERAGGGPIVPG